MAKDDKDLNLFQKLTRLFRSGPVVRRKIRNLDTTVAVADKTKSSGALLFQKSMAPTYATITANAYNLSERLMRYQDFGEMEYCLHGDTKIAVPGGYKTISELAAECEGKPDHTFLVYSYDHNLQRIIPTWGKQARQTRTDHAYTVTFDNGQQIIGTPNHRLMKRDGTFCKIEDLKAGDAMMPFYRRDLFNGCKEEGDGYRWIYTMDRRSKMNGWVAEHRVIGEMLKGSTLDKNEVVHHRNFVKSDNRPENLEVMTEEAHLRLHSQILNGAKWSEQNAEWIQAFKVNHSKFMTENNPAERKDITFGRILEVAERTGFNSRKMCEVLDTDLNVIKRRLRKHGYQDFQTFARAYNPDWHNAGWDNRGEKNPRYVKSVTFDRICSNFSKGMTNQQMAASLDTTVHVVEGRVRERGYKNYADFATSYDNLKVASVEYHGVIPLYDLTVDGYKNFATDTVISHNTPELAAALDIYADETCAQDEKGRVLHIYSDNEKIREVLEELFYNTLNVEFNLRSWARNLPVHKDTVIPLLDGTEMTIENLAKKMKEEPGWTPWVYSIQDGTKRMVPGKVTWCDLTRKDSDLVRVWLDDGTYVDCTPDHEWILRDGSRKKAEDLDDGMSLMPFYRDVSSKVLKHRLDGYERVYDPCTESYEYTHRLVAEGAVSTPPEGKWHVVHHVNFDKRNNDPSNLRKMTWADHSQLHLKSSEVLKRPDVAAKRMAGIDRWLRSDKHRSIAKEQLKKLQDTGLMKKSWAEYNESEKHKEDNTVRSEASKKMWNDRRVELKEKLSIKFDDKCIDKVVNALRHQGKYLSPVKLGEILIHDAEFMSHFSSINEGTNRDLTKPFKSHAGFEGLLNKAGASTYISLVKERLPEIAATPWFKRAVKKSKKMSGIIPKMREKHSSAQSQIYMNHKVDRIERLSEKSDVYCMEVMGPSGEHDRHNFMVLTRFATGEVNLSGGICSQNCKYGDMFLYNDVSPEHGVINAFPIPVNEIEREENYDPNDPMAVRYRWVTLGNRTLENWEVTHFRLLGNDMFLPYGSSIIEPARRIWRQLILIEDAMLVYRVVRAPERRVFYIDVANIPPENVPMYVEEQRKNLRSSQVIDRNTGRVDLRYNPLSVDEDYFIPVRGGESGTRIDTLAGGQNAAAVEDVAYIQKKLFAALKIPRAYLGYDEALSSKATLAQEDIRFSRTINVIQKTLISELNKLAIIHLYAHGYDHEDLQNFTLRLSNPSTIAQQQKLELWRTKFEIAGSAPEGQMSKEFIRKEIWGLNDEQCAEIDEQRLKEKMVDQAIENAKPEEEATGEEGGEDMFGGGEEGEEGGGEEEAGGEEEGGEELFAGDDVADKEPDLTLLTASDDIDDNEDFPINVSLKDVKVPLKAKSQLDRALYNRGRIRHNGAAATHRPDFAKMTSHDSKSLTDPYGKEDLTAFTRNPFGEGVRRHKTAIGAEVLSALRNMSMSNKFASTVASTQTSGIISESTEQLDEADAQEHRDVLIIDDGE